MGASPTAAISPVRPDQRRQQPVLGFCPQRRRVPDSAHVHPLPRTDTCRNHREQGRRPTEYDRHELSTGERPRRSPCKCSASLSSTPSPGRMRSVWPHQSIVSVAVFSPVTGQAVLFERCSVAALSRYGVGPAVPWLLVHALWVASVHRASRAYIRSSTAISVVTARPFREVSSRSAATNCSRWSGE
jgi:hypothetical protein